MTDLNLTENARMLFARPLVQEESSRPHNTEQPSSQHAPLRRRTSSLPEDEAPKEAGEYASTLVDGNVTPPAHPSTEPAEGSNKGRGISIALMKDKGFLCCKSLKCVERFTEAGSEDSRELEAQQICFAELHGRVERQDWIRTMVPFSKSSKKRRGSMIAGNHLVCNKFFRAAFGVSNTLIDEAKCNPSSRRYRKMLSSARWVFLLYIVGADENYYDMCVSLLPTTLTVAYYVDEESVLDAHT